MRPIDHPEFFTRPPPGGASRESTIRLDAEGRFWHDGDLVEHQRMAKAFGKWIMKHPDNGRWLLTNGYDWTYIAVDDVPYFVQSLRTDGSSARLVLSDETEEPLDPATLAVGERDALYVRVKDGEYEARFSRSAQTALAPLLVEHEGGVALELNGERYAIGERANPVPA